MSEASETVEASVRLHVESSGDGPPVLLGHGFGGSARNFRPQVRALKARYRVLTFDARGHARSDAPEGARNYRPEAFCRDLERILDAEKLASSVVGGLSMGAAVALRFAAMWPERVSALVLASPPPSGRGVAWSRDFAAAIESGGLESAGETYVWGEASGLDPDAARWVRQGFLEHAPHALAHILREFLAKHPAPDAWSPPLSGVTCPVLILAGGLDAASVREGEALARRLSHSRMEIVEGAGHVVNLAAPEETNRLLEQFLGSL